MESMDTNTQKNQPAYKSAFLKAAAALGFIAVLIFGAWGVLQVARLVPSIGSALSTAAVSLSSIFVPAEHLTIVMDSANVTSGEPFVVSWKHEGKRGDGTYTVTFVCRDGLSMQTLAENGVYQNVVCNVPFNLTNASSEIKLIAYSTNAKFLDVPLSLQFTRLSDGKVTATTQTALTVMNDKAVASDTTGTPTTQPAVVTPAPKPVVKPVVHKPVVPVTNTYTTYTTNVRVSDPNGHPDLAVTILNSGYIDPITNVYTPSSFIHRGDHGAVRFTVTNSGTKAVDNWNFNAVLPTFPMHIYSSDMQPALGPGDSMEYTIGFDMVDNSTTQGVFTVNVDPANSIWNEVTKNNNIAKVLFTIVN
jgi:hypothetical protein